MHSTGEIPISFRTGEQGWFPGCISPLTCSNCKSTVAEYSPTTKIGFTKLMLFCFYKMNVLKDLSPLSYPKLVILCFYHR